VTRSDEFAKNLDYEALLEAVNTAIPGFGEPRTPTRPVTFIMGVPRSGTTLAYQVLAATGAFSYPSNVAARFFASPAFGAAIERILTPLLPPEPMRFTSRAGNTDAWNGPHEFGYYWQRWLPFAEHHEPPAVDQPDAPVLTGLADELGAMEHVAGRPLLFKNGILLFSIPHLAAVLPTLRIIEVRRPNHDVCASILAMRERFTGDRANWWSTRPADAATMADRSPEEQVAFQVLRGRRALEQARSVVGDAWLEVSYASICADPRGFADRATEGLDSEGISLDGLPERFERRNTADRPVTPESRAIEAALAAVEAELGDA
jgi:hypothetical protein